jgi:predicted DNA-binding transcriptional regulator AlpA
MIGRVAMRWFMNIAASAYSPPVEPALNRHQRHGEDSTVNDVLPVGLAPALNTDQAAVYCGLARATMEGLRCKGGGPRFVRYGRKAVRYLQRDLDTWMAGLTVSSTSEAA